MLVITAFVFDEGESHCTTKKKKKREEDFTQFNNKPRRRVGTELSVLRFAISCDKLPP